MTCIHCSAEIVAAGEKKDINFNTVCALCEALAAGMIAHFVVTTLLATVVRTLL